MTSVTAGLRLKIVLLLIASTASLAFVVRPLFTNSIRKYTFTKICSTSKSTTTTNTQNGRTFVTDISSSSPEDRSCKAKEIWSTMALHPAENKNDIIYFNDDSTTVYKQNLFEQFMTIKGTYYINGLSSCQIGDRLIHPFEAHGHCKSLVFDGKGLLQYTSRIVETPLTSKERMQNKILNRGVMSTVANIDSLWGMAQNAISSKDRDTANLVANLWPLPGTKNADNIDPVLIVCTDNGEPYALDPKTLETKGRLSDVIPKLANVLPRGTTSLAHTRYDEANNRFIMCLNVMEIPGENFMGNSTFQFLEFDSNFDLVSSRKHTTRFMVCHDWVLTQNYYVVPKNPAYLKWENIMKFAFGQALGTDVFAMEEQANGEFILIPRHDKNEPVHEVKNDAFFNCFHFGPSFERLDQDELVINACVFDYYTFGGEMGFCGISQDFDPVKWGASGGMAPPPRLDQFVIDTKTFQIKKKERVPVIPIDMPNFNGDAKPLKYSYFLGASRPEGWFPFRQIVKLDLDTYESIVWDAGDGQVVSEPMFIPKAQAKSDDDGFLISIVHDSDNKNAKLMIWESSTFGEGPIAECSLGNLIPWCVHGSFYPDYNPHEAGQLSDVLEKQFSGYL